MMISKCMRALGASNVSERNSVNTEASNYNDAIEMHACTLGHQCE
jgi:hypothetical protein